MLAGVVLFLPFAVIPALSFPFQFGKVLLFGLPVLIVSILWCIHALKSGVIELPKSGILYALFALTIAYFISALVAPSTTQALIGSGSETDTTVFIFLLFLGTFVTSVVAKTSSRRAFLFKAVGIATFVLTLFVALRLILGAEFLSFGVFTNVTSNLLGKWNDLGLFFGIPALLAMIALQSKGLMGKKRLLALGVFVLSLILLIIVNFSTAWLLLGVISLGSFLYGLFGGRFQAGEENQRHIRIPALIVLVLSTVFFLGGTVFGPFIANTLGIATIEARPSWSSTITVMGDVYATDAFLGAGPNHFKNEWQMSKPAEVNQSLFWETDFSAGVSTVATSAITIGVLGILVWILFFGAFARTGMRLLGLTGENKKEAYLLTASFVVSLYLWGVLLLYVPGITLLAFTAIFTGLFIASGMNSKIIGRRTLSLRGNPRAGFIGIVLLVVFLIISIVLIYGLGSRYVSAYLQQQASVVLNQDGDTAVAAQHLESANAVSETDTAHRGLVNLGLIELNRIVSAGEPTDETRAQFQKILKTTIDHGTRAITLDQNDYQNWLVLGQVYEALVSINVEGAYENAKQTYDRAQALNPTSPAIPLRIARLELANGNTEQALSRISDALRLKNNYTEAIFLLAKIQVDQGNIPDAIRSVEATTLLEPNNPALFFQLGLLRYSESDFTGAVEALEQAVDLNNDYSNARYFLGLAYSQLARNDEAITQFERIAELNPENTEVPTIIENLKAGKKPLAGIVPDTPPEERDELPVEE